MLEIEDGGGDEGEEEENEREESAEAAGGIESDGVVDGRDAEKADDE